MSAQWPSQPGAAAFLRSGGTVVAMPGRVAALLSEALNLGTYRVKVRGQDAEVDGVLLAVQQAALAWRSGAVGGTSVAREPKSLRRSEMVGTAAAGATLGLQARAVRRAIAEDRLPASKVGAQWLIDRADLKHYRSIRRAA